MTLDMIASYPNMNAGTFVQLANGGLGGSQAAATVGQVPIFPGSGGAAVPTTFESLAHTWTLAQTFSNATTNFPSTSPTFYMGNYGVTNSPGFQFRSSTSVSSYDSWLRATGGTGADGSGNLSLLGSFLITPVAATTQLGLSVTQSGPTNLALGSNPLVYNKIAISGDQVGLIGGVGLQGARSGLVVFSSFTGPSNASNSNGNYIGGSFVSKATGSDNGTNTGAGAKGAVFAGNFVVQAGAGATDYGAFTGVETDMALWSDTTSRAIVGYTASKLNNDRRGAVYDAAFNVSGNGGTYWNCAYCTSDYNGNQGSSSTATILGFVGVGNVSMPWAIGSGVDLGDGVSTGFTFSGNAFRSKGFSVDPNGVIAGISYKIGSVLAWSGTAPSIASGCGGGTPTITASNGTAAFRVGLGTASGNTCVLTMPTAMTGWNCMANDITTHTASNASVVQIASTATQVSLTSLSSAYVSATWVSGDTIAINCTSF
jgi:hypothetical protein